MSNKKRVLFLCTGNSARSQMAEGLLRQMAGDKFDVFSAGTHPKGLHPRSVEAMKEAGIDIAHQQSKDVSVYNNQTFDYVITVCDHAAEACPVFPGRAERILWSFPDPAAAVGGDMEKLAAFRMVRDAIEERLRGWVGESTLSSEDRSTS